MYLRSFYAAKGVAQRGAAAATSHRKEHRRRQHGQASSPAAADSRSMADTSASRQARVELSHGAAWDGAFELSHEQPRLSGQPSAFASISEAALVVRRGHAAQQQHLQPSQHAQLGSTRQPPAAGPSYPTVGTKRTAAPGLHPASDSRQDSHAASPAADAGSDFSVIGRHGAVAGDEHGSRLMAGSAAGAPKWPPTVTVRFHVGAGAGLLPSTHAGTQPPRSSASTAQHGARPEPDATSASEPAPSSSVTNPWVDSSAALCASAVTSLLEGPVEMFRHRLQVCDRFHAPYSMQLLNIL